MTLNKYQTRALDGLLGLLADTSIDANTRFMAGNSVLHFSPAPIFGDDRFEITTAGEAALLEAEAEAAAGGNGATVPPDAPTAEEPAEAPKRKRRTKAEMEAARAAIAESTAESAEQIRSARAITDTPEDRREPADLAQERREDRDEAEDVHQPSPSDPKPAGAVEESGDPTDAEPEVDWDAPEEPKADTAPVTKTELIALLNRYAAKHPKKAAGAKEVLSTYAGTESLSAVDPSDYGAIATAMRTYLEAA